MTVRAKLALLALKTIFRGFEIYKKIKNRENMSVLDAGCGDCSPVALIMPQLNHQVIGLDIFEPALRKARSSSDYNGLILGDVSYLPFKDNSFDISVCTAVLEHLEKSDGDRLLSELERVSKWLVLVSCPIGKWAQHALDGNPYQEHKYVWSLDELRDKGFRKIRGVGLKGMSGKLWGSLLRSPIGFVLGIITLIGTLVSYRLPEIASGVIVWKDMV